MKSNSENIDAIYIDTNIILSLTLRTFDQSFLELTNILYSNNSNIPLIIPQTVSLEWFYHHYKTYETKRDQTKTNLNEISLLLNNKQSTLKLPKDEFKQLMKSYKNKLKSLKIIECKTPKNISINDLVLGATLKIRPFEEKGEKGFRDTVILYTVLEDMRVKKYSNCIFITNDNIFLHKDVQKKISNYKVNLVIQKSFSDTVAYFNNILNKAERDKIELRKNKILSFLNSKSKEIFEFVKSNATISEDFITKGGFLSSKYEIIGRIEKVIEFIPIKISSAFDRSEFFKKEKHPDNIMPLSITVDVSIKIVYSPYIPFSQPSVSVAEIDKFKENLMNASPKYYGDPIEEIVQRKVTVYALIERGEDQNYLKLKLESVFSL